MILKEFATINIVPMNEDFGMKGMVTTAERALPISTSITLYYPESKMH